MKPLGKIKIEWSPEFAYAIGLIATDGCLYNDGRHLSLTTKDQEQADNFVDCLGLTVKIGKKSRGYSVASRNYKSPRWDNRSCDRQRPKRNGISTQVR